MRQAAARERGMEIVAGVRRIVPLLAAALALTCSGEDPVGPDVTAPLRNEVLLAGSEDATIVTDRADYAPTDTVVVSGSNWAPGETVHLVLVEEPLIHGPREWDVVADAEGNFTDASFSPEFHHLGVTFTLTATGLTSGATAQATFTDSHTVELLVTPANAPSSTSRTYTVAINLRSNVSSLGSVRITPTLDWTGFAVVPGSVRASGTKSWNASVAVQSGLPRILLSAATNTNTDRLTTAGQSVLVDVTATTTSTSGVKAWQASGFATNAFATSMAVPDQKLNIGSNSKSATGVISPVTAAAGATTTYTLTITRTLGGDPLGSVAVAVPLGFSVISVAAPTAPAGKTWNHSIDTGTGLLKFWASNDASRLSSNGQSVSIQVTANAPLTGSAYEWRTGAWKGFHFDDDPFNTTQPSVTVQAAAATTTELSADPDSPQTAGTSVTFTATVTDAAVVNAGTVSFYRGGVSCSDLTGATQIGAAQNVVAGEAEVTTSGLPVGSHTIRACYSGAPAFQASGDALPYTIGAAVAGTTTSVTADVASPQEFGESVVFTAEVNHGGGDVTTGAVTFHDGGTCAAPGAQLQAATALNGEGTATYTTSSLSVGAHTILACYGGAAGFGESGGSLAFTIVDIGTQTTVTADETSPQDLGTEVVFTAEVNRANGGADVTTGAVTFHDGGTCAAPGTQLQAATALNGEGTATYTTSSLSVGAHTILACYGGATNVAASSGSLPFSVQAVTTTVELTVTPSTQQYSDLVDLGVAVSPTTVGSSTLSGNVQFQKSTNGGASFSNLGGAVALVGGAAALEDHPITQAAGTDVRFKAVFTSTNSDFAGGEDAASLTVTKEEASIAYAGANPSALQVSAAGGSLNANVLSLGIQVREKTPDLATATAAAGNIALAALNVSLAPVAGGSAVALSCTAGVVSGSGYSAVKSYTCSNSSALPVNTYEVNVTVVGNYYAGAYTDAFTVFDPSLGFATGGGTFLLDGDRVNFGFTMKYNNKKYTNLQGNFIAVRHYADGTIARMKSTALGGLAVKNSNGCGIATFNGKANYTYWDPAANAGAGGYVTVGGGSSPSFTVYAEDCNNPGSGLDYIWMSGPAKLNVPSPASTYKATLTGGNVAVPHTRSSK